VTLSSVLVTLLFIMYVVDLTICSAFETVLQTGP